MDISPADLNLPPTQPLDLTELNDRLLDTAQNETANPQVRQTPSD